MVVPIRLAKRTCEGRLTGPVVEATLKIRGQLTLRRAKVAGEVGAIPEREIFMFGA